MLAAANMAFATCRTTPIAGKNMNLGLIGRGSSPSNHVYHATSSSPSTFSSFIVNLKPIRSFRPWVSTSYFQGWKPDFLNSQMLGFTRPHYPDQSGRSFAVEASAKKNGRSGSSKENKNDVLKGLNPVVDGDKKEQKSNIVTEGKASDDQESISVNPTVTDLEVDVDDEENADENRFYEVPLYETIPEDEDDDKLENDIEDDEEFDFEDEIWEDFEEGYEPKLGDGKDGGGIVLGDKPWCKLVAQHCYDVLQERTFNNDLQLFALKVNSDTGLVQVRLDKLSNTYGSPSVEEIEAFSQKLYAKFDFDEKEGLIPAVALEVSSPGAERVIRVPDDLERFEKLPMVVKYYVELEKDGEHDVSKEVEEVFMLVEVNREEETTTWKLADIRKNRELMGKGRQLNKKQRERRVVIPYKSLDLVKLYIDI